MLTKRPDKSNQRKRQTNQTVSEEAMQAEGRRWKVAKNKPITDKLISEPKTSQDHLSHISV